VRQFLDPWMQRNPDTCSNQHCECENSGRFRILTPEDGSDRTETYVGFDNFTNIVKCKIVGM
jgi:hypothetical protein